MMHSLRSEALSFGYDKAVPVLNALTASFATGEAVCILGGNGAGKSTFLSCLINYLKPSAGQVTFDGQDIRSIPTAEYAARVALIPQTYEMTFPYTVLDVVLMGRTPYLGGAALPGAEDYVAAEAALEDLGIAALARRSCAQLSGGQLQLVMIARALAQASDFILLDEPTAHLDFGNQARVIQTVLSLKAQAKGLILTTHNPEHAFSGFDRALLFHGGALLADGAPEDVVTKENLERLYGIPISIHRYTENGVQRTSIQPSLK